jgi:hypothetical protein
MRWLLIGNLSPAVSEALVRHGHTVTTPADAGLPEHASVAETLAFAHQKQLDVLTNRHDLAVALFGDSSPTPDTDDDTDSPPTPSSGGGAKGVRFIRTLVYLQLPGGDVEQDDAIDRLFDRYKRLATGRLYTITESRVKIRQLPTTF